MGRSLLVAATLALAGAGLFCGTGTAGGPKLLVGAAEDIVRQPTITQAKAQLDLMSLAGLKAVRITTTWSPGLRAPLPGEQNAIDIVADAASLTGMRMIVQVFHKDFATTPLTDGGRNEFAAYTAAIARDNPTIRDFVIGNEPNLNRFWMPQFALDGTSLSPTAYLALLARTYDELKKVSPKVQVIGGAVSPRGGDRAGGIRPTHSPTRFITELGNAYRQTGRPLPVMDSFAIHPYQDNSSTPPGFAHPNNTTIAIADYDKLVTLLGQAFDGTAQPGSTLPIFYGEFGVESVIPSTKSAMYTGTEIESVKPVDNATQAKYYREALAMAFCQPNVTTFLFFHTVDESNLDRWQSGMYYADGTPKPSLTAVEDAARDTRGGVIAKCTGLSLSPVGKVSYPRGKSLTKVPLKVKLKCDIDCKYRVRLERHPLGSTTLSTRGTALAGVVKMVNLPARRIARGDYRFTVTLTAPLNARTPTELASRPVAVGVTPVQGQYVAYSFFKVSPEWRRLPVEERAAGKDAFAEVIEDWAGRLEHLQAYSTAGVRPDCDFFVWKVTERYLDFEELGTELNATPLAGWLDTPYSYLATTKTSQYTSARRARKVVPRGSPYLVVYPFVKVRPWYALPAEDRQRAMDEHIATGASFPSIHNHTTYSFGIDDQEFMTAFECDEPADFMHLMLTLRESEASRYTERDTPIFVGHKVEIREALDQLDGAVTRTAA